MCARLLNCHPAPRWNVTLAHGWQYGGGLYISGTATLTNTNVYANQADNVCLPFEYSLIFCTVPPLPRWNKRASVFPGRVVAYSSTLEVK